MGKLLKILVRGFRFCILLLVVSLSICLAGGLVRPPETEEKESPYQTPQVTVVDPGQGVPAGTENRQAEARAEPYRLQMERLRMRRPDSRRRRFGRENL